MILLGRNLSPFVRRSATVLNLLGIEYEQQVVNTVDDAEAIRKINPLGRVPALILDDEVIVDSAAIIDYVLEIADPEHTFLAASGAARRATLLQSALATGAMEKAVASAYEASQRPKEFFYAPYRDRLRSQAEAGLLALVEQLGGADWFGGAKPNLADVNAVVAYDFIGIVAPKIIDSDKLSGLSALSERANVMPAFSSTLWQG